MKGKILFLSGIAILLVINASFLVQAICNAPTNGNWNINSTEICTDRTIIMNGNITITPTGNLILENVTLTINSSFNGEYVINNSGTFVVNNSIVTSQNKDVDSKYEWWNLPGSSITIQNTEITYLGHNDFTRTNNMQRGLYIQTDNAIIRDSNITVVKDGSNTNVYALYLYGAENAQIINNTITSAFYRTPAVYLLSGSNNVLIENNTITSTGGLDADCVRIYSSQNVRIRGNNITTSKNRDYPIRLNNADYTNITNNNIQAYDTLGTRAIDITNSQGCLIHNNNITTRDQPVYITATSITDFNHNITLGNLVNGNKKIYYYYNVQNLVLQDTNDAAMVQFANSNNITIRNNNFTYAGIIFSQTTNSTITNNYFNGTTPTKTIYLELNSNNNIITYNNIDRSAGNGLNGIYMRTSSENNLTGNNVTVLGINAMPYAMYASANNNIIRNTITLTNDQNGYIWIYDSDNNLIENSNITTSIGSSTYGIKIQNANNNNITNTVIRTSGSTGYGVYFYNADNSNIINTTLNAISARDVYFAGSGTNYLINTIFNKSDVEFYSGATGSLFVKWYLDVYVRNGTFEPIQGANVSAYDNTGELVFSELTASIIL